MASLNLSYSISPIIFILYISYIPQPLDAQLNLSYLADDIAIWGQAPGFRSINLRLQKYLNKVLPWCDRWRIKLNPGKSHLINFSQRKVIKDTLVSIYRRPLKVNESPKFLFVHVDNHIKTMKLHVEHTEWHPLRITWLNSIKTALLIPLYKIFTRPYMDYSYTALTAFNKTLRQKLHVI